MFSGYHIPWLELQRSVKQFAIRDSEETSGQTTSQNVMCYQILFWFFYWLSLSAHLNLYAYQILIQTSLSGTSRNLI